MRCAVGQVDITVMMCEPTKGAKQAGSLKKFQLKASNKVTHVSLLKHPC